MRKVRHFKKKIFIEFVKQGATNAEKKKAKYVTVRIFHRLKDLRWFYRKLRPQDDHIDKTLGAHVGYTIDREKSKEKYWYETGTVLFSAKHCGAGLISHEFLHALFWAHGHTPDKEQYPLTISFKNMDDEEAFCYLMTDLVGSFFRWFYKLERKGKIKIS